MTAFLPLLNRNKHAIGLAISVLLFIALGLMVMQPEPERMEPYVSYSAEPDGTKGMITLLQEKRVPVKTWKRSWRELPAGSGHKLLSIEPHSVNEDEWQELLEWVERGNDLLLFSRSIDGGAVFQLEDTSAAPGVAVVTRQDGGVKAEFTAEVNTNKRIVAEDGVSSLLRDSNGIVAASRAYGDGAITAVVVPNWLTNASVLQHDHFELVWPWLTGDGNLDSLWVDEYHHGYIESRGALEAYPDWLIAGSGVMAVTLLLWLWQQGKRFGPAYTPRAWTVRRGDETLLAVAAWYERRRFKDEALAHQVRALRRLLLVRWGLRLEASPEEAAQLAQDRLSEAQADKLVRLLRQADAVERGEAMGGSFVDLTRELGEMIVLLEKE
ncbi:DUF4350 domain-containing protein [Paenibacillus koleovorans]|uniref:DUF4350 domain-containing protein n=1 Tax=Paenibacillus koleovorans TaxID=121608 RepID=UPI000FD9AFB2|nr:DUF4350 domain-containing protein [Paenibacillus koleovorans]